MARETRAQRAEREAAKEDLRAILKPGDTVHGIVRHVARSGMSRDIDFYVMQDNEMRWLSPAIARAIGWKMSKDRGIKVQGCGMDMIFHTVYTLSSVLFPAGFGCIGKKDRNGWEERCPSNDHSNGDRDYRPHVDDTPQCSEEVGTDIPRKRAHSHWHLSGGYALRYRQI